MGRLVNPASSSGGPVESYAGATPPDDTFSRVAKYIPGESLSVYLAFQSLLSTPEPWGYFVYAVILALTPVYVWRMAERNQPWRMHAIIATVGFVVWSYALHAENKFSPFPENWYSDVFAATLILLFPFVVGALFVPKK